MLSQPSSVLRINYVALIAMFGLGPNECSIELLPLDRTGGWRHYGAHDTPDPLLIIAAPIKRPSIWDLAPSVSVIRNCLGHGLDVHLLEWLPASTHTGNNGLVVQQDVANAFRLVDDEDTESPDRGTGAYTTWRCRVGVGGRGIRPHTPVATVRRSGSSYSLAVTSRVRTPLSSTYQSPMVILIAGDRS